MNPISYKNIKAIVSDGRKGLLGGFKRKFYLLAGGEDWLNEKGVDKNGRNYFIHKKQQVHIIA